MMSEEEEVKQGTGLAVGDISAVQIHKRMSVTMELVLSIIHKYSPLTTSHDHPAPESQIEQFLYDKICIPVAKQLPVGVILPNHITIANVFVAWSSFLCALAARNLEDSYVHANGHIIPLLLRIIVAGLVFLHMFFDSLDGSYARISKQTSDVGEILDHGLDAVNVQLISAGILISIGFPPWVIGITQAFSSFVYNAQIVLYKVTGKMVNPPTNGVDAETGGILLHLIVGFYLFIFGKNWIWNIFATVAAIAANIGQVHDWIFFFKRFPPEDKDFELHLALVGACIPFVLMIAFGLIPRPLFVLMYSIVALRCTGVVVVHTVTEKKRSLAREASQAFVNYHDILYNWGWSLFFLLSFNSIFTFFSWTSNLAVAGFIAHLLYQCYTESMAAIILMRAQSVAAKSAKKAE